MYLLQAKKRGAGSMVIGMVVGFLELGVVVAAPLMGYLVSQMNSNCDAHLQ